MLNRYFAALGISLVALIGGYTLDRLLHFLPPLWQLLIQVPLLVILIDEFRRWCTRNAPRLGLTETDVNGAFFFAAPLAALASETLLADIRMLLPFSPR